MTLHFRGKRREGYLVDLPTTPFTFPAGESHIKIDESFNPDDYEYLIADLRWGTGSDHELFQLALWADAMHEIGGTIPKFLFLPYLPAARADRGKPLGIKIYAQFLKNLGFNRTFVLDPHSKESASRVARMEEVPFEVLVKNHLAHPHGDRLNVDHEFTGVIAPDKGARDRAHRAASVLHVDTFTAGKTRDFETGQLTGFHMEDELPEEGHFLIVDDICDGGGTFIGLAESIKKTNPNVKLSLWVNHGIFSKGVDSLLRVFQNVYTTDSTENAIKEYHHDRLKVVSITDLFYQELALRVQS